MISITRDAGLGPSLRKSGAMWLLLEFAATLAYAQGSATCSLTPATLTKPAGSSHALTATVTSNGIPRPAVPVTFSVASGPNAGKTAAATTNSNGQAAFTYPSAGIVGTDVIQAGGTDPATKEDFRCTEARISWTVGEPGSRKCQESWIYTAGVPDAFLDDVSPSEPAYAGPSLQSRLGSKYSNFDQLLPNSQFGHTITFADLAALVDCGTCAIFSATLEIRLSATNDAPANDSIHLESQGSSFAWGARLAPDGATPGILAGSWQSGRTETLQLNLAALPLNPPSNILADLNDGALDVYVQDDTGVDYMTLEITTVCNCTEIHGRKFADTNENGMKDSNEDYLEGFIIQLLDADGVLLATASTDANGDYEFTGLHPGTYTVTEDGFQSVPLPCPNTPCPPQGWHQTFPESGGHVVTLAPGQVAQNLNFGNSPLFCNMLYSQYVNVIDKPPFTGNLNSAELIIGSSGDDVIEGRGGGDCIYGLGGNDDIHGDGGSTINVGKDTIYGGPGNDTIYGDGNDDFISGGGGNDYLQGDSGKDQIHGNSGRDKLLGDTANDYLYGGTENDFLVGDAGDDHLYGQGGDDRLCGNSGGDVLDGGPGIDRGNSESGNDTDLFESANPLQSKECTKNAFKTYPL